MLVLTVREGSCRTLTRRVDGPVCLFPVPTEDPWLAWPDDRGSAVLVASPTGQLLCRLADGDTTTMGAITLRVHRATSDDTDRIAVRPHRPTPLALCLPSGTRHVLSTREITVGSHPDCDVVLADPTVSGRHCDVVVHRGGWVARDLGSTNGLWLSGARVPAAVLSPGLELTLGRTRVLCAPAEPTETALLPSGVPGALVGRAASMHTLRTMVLRYANAPYAVLIEGESGTGKELVARDLHARSPRCNGPLVTVNCGAVATSVMESELFGHERGAFTGAIARRRGVFEEAHGGTLFLDEVGELPLALQPALLRVLETGEIRRVGGEGSVRVSVRVIAATLRDLFQRVREGLFREDLYYRLADFRLRVPPLRARRVDIPVLVDHLLARIETETGRARVLEDHALGRLMVHDWPGNVRELLSVLKRAVFLSDGERIGPEHLELPPLDPRVLRDGMTGGADGTVQAMAPPDVAAPTPVVQSRPPWPPDVAPNDLQGLLAWCEGNTSRAARILGVPRSTFRERLRRQASR